MPTYRHMLGAAMVLLVVPLSASVIGFASGSEKAPFLQPVTAGSACVLDASAMRYHHMTYLKELRDQVVRSGVRDGVVGSAPRGMSSCHSCHADRTQFCDKCHNRAGVTPDCFGCHSY
jgi:hypothetical protein